MKHDFDRHDFWMAAFEILIAALAVALLASLVYMIGASV